MISSDQTKFFIMESLKSNLIIKMKTKPCTHPPTPFPGKPRKGAYIIVNQ
jgi:hypothetical protein